MYDTFQEYIGKPLSDLINDTPDYALNFFDVYGHKNFRLKDVMKDEKAVTRKIKSIKGVNDYTYFITLE